MERQPPPLDLSWVTPQLAVGGSYPVEAAEHLARRMGIEHVVDLRVEACDDATALARCGIELLHLPTDDTCAVAQHMLDEGVLWVIGRLSRGGRVLIHCQHGIGRSALLALCVLVAQGDRPLHALERAKTARRQVSPSPAQLEAFRAWLVRRGWTAEVPSFSALAQIAYRHLAQAEAQPASP
jgi:predicted protein tyrosine phosphatase